MRPIVYIIIIIITLLISFKYADNTPIKEPIQKDYYSDCINRGMIMTANGHITTNDWAFNKCMTKQEYCFAKVRETYVDLSDTWGVNTNNQDSISKTMESSINICMGQFSGLNLSK